MTVRAQPKVGPVFPVCVLTQRQAQLLAQHLEGYFLTSSQLAEITGAIRRQLATEGRATTTGSR